MARSPEAVERRRQWQASYRAAHREEMKAYSKAHYQRTKDKRKKQLQEYRIRLGSEWGQRQRKYGMKHTHGITPEQYDEMLIQQEGRCALCPTEHGDSGRGGKLHIDHDHKTGEIRGLLCMWCNHAIERLDNHDGWAVRAQEYLKRPR